MRALLALCFAVAVDADVRFASRPKKLGNQPGSYELITENGAIDFIPPPNSVTKYMEPSTFEYNGLAGANGQKNKDYDQFLRSNIDNEQDNRKFESDEGKDHLPFRTVDTGVHRQESQVDLTVEMAAGEAKLIPFRWNNPHSSEVEVNIWIFPKDSPPVVVPIKRPSCIGEGYSDNLIKFIIPRDFGCLTSKIPGFTGCNADTYPMCTVQVYSHTVESRTYAMAFPIVVTGVCDAPVIAQSFIHNSTRSNSTRKLLSRTFAAPSCDQIKKAPVDPGMDLSNLRPLCRDSQSESQHIESAVPQWANLFSDVYNHAYQNSDYSPYSGQQHDQISQNLQAACINKMVTGNRGELGQNALPAATKKKIADLKKKEDYIYKKYEQYANKIIKKLGDQVPETNDEKMLLKDEIEVDGTSQKQQLANCFRCRSAASTTKNRQQQTTYIPSFKLPESLIDSAKKLITTAEYKDLITPDGVVQIYVASMNKLMPDFLDAAEEYGVLYQPAMRKNTLATMPDATQFKKRTYKGEIDNGKYAATEAKLAQAKSVFNCEDACLKCGPGKGNKKPLIQDGTGTCITGQCSGCAAFFSNTAATAASADQAWCGADDVHPYYDQDSSLVSVANPSAISLLTFLLLAKILWFC